MISDWFSALCETGKRVSAVEQVVDSVENYSVLGIHLNMLSQLKIMVSTAAVNKCLHP